MSVPPNSYICTVQTLKALERYCSSSSVAFFDVLPRNSPEILPCKEESTGVFSKGDERSDGMISKFPFPENVSSAGRFLLLEGRDIDVY